jgi:(2Fe-2S) ferredoxin
MKDLLGRQARSRRLIICTGPCCDSEGTATILVDEIRAELARACRDADVLADASCVKRACLGRCIGEPLACVQPDETWYHRLSVEGLLRILREHVLENRILDDLVLDEQA